MRRVAFTAVLTTASWAATALVTPGVAQACKCARGTTASDAAAKAAAVFEGRVLTAKELTPVGQGRSSTDLIRYEVDVLRTWKGSPVPGEQVEVSAGRSESSCGRRFDVGETYLFYVSTFPDGGFADGLCSRTSTLSWGPSDVEELGLADGKWDESRRPKPKPVAVAPVPPPVEAPPPAKTDPGPEPEPQAQTQPRAEAEVAPPPTPSERGCAIAGGSTPGRWLLLVPVLVLMRRRR